ncbi:MAG: hypothetical protein ACKVPX_16155 [Myxococcaceae bacterium]
MRVTFSSFASPIGDIQLAESARGLCALTFGDLDAAFAGRASDWLRRADTENVSLSGYSGGTGRKAWLLEHERRHRVGANE